MVKQYIVALFRVVQVFMLLGVIAIGVNIVKYISPGILSKMIIPCIMAAPVVLVCGGGIYRHAMKRNKELAPESPYDFQKLATLDLKEDNEIFVKKWMIL